jgi:hypothetical protein
MKLLTFLLLISSTSAMCTFDSKKMMFKDGSDKDVKLWYSKDTVRIENMTGKAVTMLLPAVPSPGFPDALSCDFN